MKKKKFMYNALILTSTMIVNQTIGVFFRIYMSNTIGTVGLGLYRLITSVYMFSVTFCTSAVSLVVTRLLTEDFATTKGKNIKGITTACLLIGIVLSFVAGVALFFYAENIGLNILKDERTILSLKILAPSLPFMAISSCLRGFFYARRTAVKTAVEQLIEQITEIIIFAIIIGSLSPHGLEYACASIAIGTTVAEVVTCIYAFIMYKIDVEKFNSKIKITKEILKKNVTIGVPVMASSCLRTGLMTVENILIPWGLLAFGMSYEKSLSQFGIISTLVIPIIFFPSAFLISFSSLIIPELSQEAANKHKKSIRYMTTRIIRFCFLFSIPISVMFFFFANDISMLLYGNIQAGYFLKLLAPSIPLFYLDMVVDGMLKGLNEQLHYLTYNIVDSVIRVTLLFFATPIFGINAVIVIMYISAILNCTLSVERLLKITNLHLNIVNWILKPIISISVPCIIVSMLYKNNILQNNNLLTIAVLALCGLLYLILILITGCMQKEELSWIKRSINIK